LDQLIHQLLHDLFCFLLRLIFRNEINIYIDFRFPLCKVAIRLLLEFVLFLIKLFIVHYIRNDSQQIICWIIDIMSDHHHLFFDLASWRSKTIHLEELNYTFQSLVHKFKKFKK
jgi:hypothetical protein